MEELESFFKIMSDQTRIRIMVLLDHEELCVCQICGILDLSQPKISKHLAKLKSMNFVKAKKKEQYVFYSLNLEDEVMYGVLESIKCKLNKYPKLMLDVENLKNKEAYINKLKKI